jgi:hypothetical protein
MKTIVMKTLITLFFGLLISGLIYSQDYYPIVQENNEWNVLQVIYPGGNPWDTTYWTMTYKFYGDTMISEQSYKKVYKSEEEIPINWEYEGAIREEEQKVWYFPKFGNGETKIYDFTMNIGDTVTFLFEPMVVDSIISEEINGEDRRHIYFSYPDFSPFKECWIEGIGSNRGILQSGTAMFVGGWTWFLCMSENGELIYMNPNYNSCHLISTDIEETDNFLIEVYPNPAYDKINIKNTANIKIESISITDLKGQKILEFEKNKTELNLSGISTGIYLLMVNYENGELIKKILVE